MSRNSVVMVLVVPALVIALLASLLTQTAHATKAEDGSKVPASFYDSSVRNCDSFGVAYTNYNEQGEIILLTNERAARGIAEDMKRNYDMVVEFSCDNSDVVDSNGEIIPVSFTR